MAQLLDLSNEILILIFEDAPILMKRSRHYSILCLVCNRFQLLCRPLVFRDVVLWKAPPGLSNWRFRLFARSIREAPYIALMVQNIQLRFLTDSSMETSLVNLILERLTMVRKLNIYLIDYRCRQQFLPAFVGTNKMEHLDELTINEHGCHPAALGAYILLKNIRRLSVQDLLWVTYIPLPADDSFELSNLSILYLRKIQHGNLRELLSKTPSIKELSCYVYSKITGFSESVLPINFDPRNSLFSPRLTSLAIEPAFQTLETLVLSNNTNDWSKHDGSRLDLSSFQRLKSCVTSGYHFFPISIDKSNYNSRLGFYKLLPRSIELIQIEFDGHHNVIFTPKKTDDNKFPEQPQLECPELGWLIETLRYKEFQTPKLVEIGIDGGYSPTLSIEEDDDSFTYLPATSVTKAAYDANVELNINLSWC